MRETAAQAAEKNLRLHTHLAETEDENAFCQAKFNKRPLDYLEDLNWLTPRTWFAHGIHFSPSEITRMAATGCCVAHCPTSNMILGSGICPVSALESAGVGVGLGVDGSASNDSSNLIQELRHALLLQRVRHNGRTNGDITAATHQDPIRWATTGSARCLGRPDLGRLEPGAAADIALFKLDEPRFSGAGDPLAALITCGAHRADRVMVAGHWRVIDAAIPNLDLAALIATHTAAAHRLRCA
jgi:8-oxoguanine deaminase